VSSRLAWYLISKKERKKETRTLYTCVHTQINSAKLKGTKMNKQIFIVFPHAINKPYREKIKKTFPFTITSIRIKILRHKLKEDAYTENYKTLLKEIESCH
jgi:hypothetical protein